MLPIPDDCKTCKTQDNCPLLDDYIGCHRNLYVMICPCKKCLIKSMCTNSCSDYINLDKRHFEDRKKEVKYD